MVEAAAVGRSEAAAAGRRRPRPRELLRDRLIIIALHIQRAEADAARFVFGLPRR